jgi:hypothetical protein
MLWIDVVGFGGLRSISKWGALGWANGVFEGTSPIVTIEQRSPTGLGLFCLTCTICMMMEKGASSPLLTVRDYRL